MERRSGRVRTAADSSTSNKGKYCKDSDSSSEAESSKSDQHNKTAARDSESEKENKNEDPRKADKKSVQIAGPAGLNVLLARNETQASAIAEQTVPDDTGNFVCRICNSKEKQRLDLEVHLRRHFGECMFACRICEEEFVSIDVAKDHLKKNLCGTSKEISSEEAIAATITIPPTIATAAKAKVDIVAVERKKTKSWSMASEAKKDADNKFSCPQSDCRKTGITYRSTLEIHLRRHFQEYVHACHSCQRPYISTSEMNGHMKRCIINGVRGNIEIGQNGACQLNKGADQETSGKKELETEAMQKGAVNKRHTEEDLDLNGSMDSMKNQNAEENLGNESTTTVPKREETQAYLISMNTKPYRTNPKMFACTICEKNTFNRKGILERHLRRHFKEYIFFCNSCQKKFYDKDKFIGHKCAASSMDESQVNVASDTAEVQEPDMKPFNRKTSTAYSTSMEATPDPDPKGSDHFRCSVCKKTVCKTRIQLEIHLRKHFSEFTCLCNKCGKRFHNASKLRSHFRECKSSCVFTVAAATEHDANDVLMEIDSSNIEEGDRDIQAARPSKIQKRMKLSIQERQQQSLARPTNMTHLTAPLSPQINMNPEYETVTEDVPNVFECAYCRKQFPRHERKSHLLEHRHNGDSFLCKFCTKPFSTRKNRFIHERIHMGVKYACEVCRTEFGSRSSLRRHRLRQSCTQQKPESGSASEQEMETEEVLADRNTAAPSCSTSAVIPHSRSELLQESIKSPLGKTADGRYQCSYCKKTFTTSWSKTSHENIHKGMKPYKCDVCGRSFHSAQQKRAHRRAAHVLKLRGPASEAGCNLTPTFPNMSKLYRCGFCKKNFSISALKDHIKTHIGERPFKSSYARRHMKSKFGHELDGDPLQVIPKKPMTTTLDTNKQQRFRCKQCNSEFLDVIMLQRHMQSTHADVRPFNCQSCGRGFYSKANHIKHVRDILCVVDTKQTDVEGSPSESRTFKSTRELFECCYCGKHFSTVWNLRLHERLHTGDLPYRCNVCNRGYIDKHELVSHLNKAHTMKVSRSEIEPCVLVSETLAPKTASFTELDLETEEKKKDDVHEPKVASGDLACNTVNDQPDSILQPSNAPKGQINPQVQARTRVGSCKCDLCGKEIMPRYFRAHVRTHTGEKPYKCRVCDARFVQPSPAKKHMRAIHGLIASAISDLHTGDRSVPSITIRPSSPVKEIVIGELERISKAQAEESFLPPTISSPSNKKLGKATVLVPQYPCNRCDKAFAEATLLAAHIENVHIEQRPFHCVKCQRGFFAEAAFWRHVNNNLCRRRAEADFAAAAASLTSQEEFQQEEERDVEAEDVKRGRVSKSQLSKYPWVLQVLNGPYCYECEECDARFTKEVIAEAHRQWHKSLALARSTDIV